MRNINIQWFRNDLRLSDNLSFTNACKGDNLLSIFIFNEEQNIGAASKIWLHHSLNSLNNSLDNKLNIYIRKPQNIFEQLIKQYNIEKVYWNKVYEPKSLNLDKEIEKMLKSQNIKCESYNSSLLWEPSEIIKDDKTSYKVYTPFYRKAVAYHKKPRFPLSAPKILNMINDINNKTTINDLFLLPKWDHKIDQCWDIGESAAQKKLELFLNNNLKGYEENRNFPAKQNISKLSPHLHFGEISPNQIWYAAETYSNINLIESDSICFSKELIWREFSYNLLYHFPNIDKNNFQPKFDNFPWEYNKEFLLAWQKGKTGYPIIDAGMRELWQTGFMHNRVRMIVGSFLVKNLLIHWHHGAEWFWDCLVDADLASNSCSWQWVAGSGADAAPYFRIFNPVSQGERFDPDGEYTLKYIPELKKIPKRYIHSPWTAPKMILEFSGITLGKTYPNPIINLTETRDRALRAYNKIK